MTKTMTEYGYEDSRVSTEATWYENQNHQHDQSTCTTWAIHLNIYEQELAKVLQVLSERDYTTGQYVFGDSWKEWGEEAEGAHDLHFVGYFTLDGTRTGTKAERAERIADSLAKHVVESLSRPLVYVVSTSADWAEQPYEGVIAPNGTITSKHRR